MKKRKTKPSSKKQLNKKKGSEKALSLAIRKKVSKSKKKRRSKPEKLRKEEVIKNKKVISKKQSTQNKKTTRPKAKKLKPIKVRKVKPRMIRPKKAGVKEPKSQKPKVSKPEPKRISKREKRKKQKVFPAPLIVRPFRGIKKAKTKKAPKLLEKKKRPKRRKTPEASKKITVPSTKAVFRPQPILAPLSLRMKKETKKKIAKKAHKKRLETSIVSPPELKVYKPSIKVVGVGGAGCRIVSEMAEVYSLPEVEFIAINTDKQSLFYLGKVRTLAIGQSLTRGLGTGMNIQLGREAAKSDKDKIQAVLSGADMIFIISGLGGGTGSGASPIIAETAKKSGTLVVGMVTRPFGFEGAARTRIAEEGLEELEPNVNTLITISNDKVWQQVERGTPLKKAFGDIDKMLRQGIKGIVDLILTPGLINVDFADVKAVMEDGGHALIGIGQARGENRAEEAAFRAMNSPLLDFSIEGATGVLFSIAGGEDLKMLEVDKAAKIITEDVDPEAKIIFGAIKDNNLEGKMRIILIATGLGKLAEKPSEEDLKQKPPFYGDESKHSEKEASLDLPAFIRRKMKNE